ncbi:MAG TPA: gamma-glutamylcyclotransferase [Sneathiellales bacterium]|jgi:cation transport protein ChaC|nr:gamma-glutamylcyclotransferase [Sneathiellales bacterium]
MLTRELILNGYVKEIFAKSDGSTPLLSDEEIDASCRASLADAPPGDIWLFGYGSLIWNPTIHFAEKRIGKVAGYHRRFCLWTHLGRGCPECPGLLLGLEHGGSCGGVVFRIPAAQADHECRIVWHREMVSGSYIPRWVDVQTDDGPVRAIAFIINRDHVRYAGRLSDERVAETLANAEGPLGNCADYLINTADHLEELGILDAPLQHLRTEVQRLCAAKN